jgi:hypothetical protein
MPRISNREPLREKPVVADQEKNLTPQGSTVLSTTTLFTLTTVLTVYIYGLDGDHKCGENAGVVNVKVSSVVGGIDIVLL